MKVSYLSHSLTIDTPSYGNRDRVILDEKSSIAAGDTSNTTDVRLTNNHIGTHFDVPKHFFENGITITDIDPSDFFFECIKLIDIKCEKGRLIEIEDIKTHKIPDKTEFLIIRTGFENFRGQDVYWNAYPGITEKACEYLRGKLPKLRAIGFDFISLTSPIDKEQGKKAHEILLKKINDKFVIIVEDMKIAHLNNQVDNMSIIIAPMLIEGGNGGPVTIFAWHR